MYFNSVCWSLEIVYYNSVLVTGGNGIVYISVDSELVSQEREAVVSGMYGWVEKVCRDVRGETRSFH